MSIFEKKSLEIQLQIYELIEDLTFALFSTQYLVVLYSKNFKLSYHNKHTYRLV